MNDEIVVSFQMVNSYLRRLVADLTIEQMVSQPTGAQNHPVWVIGHLLHSYQGIGGEIGIPPWLPPDWMNLFGTGTIPRPEVGIYPTKTELLDALADAESRLVAAVAKMTADDFRKDLPDLEYRKTLPTVGHALVQILIGHSSVHIGQLTVWRSAMHLPRVPEFFDRS